MASLKIIGGTTRPGRFNPQVAEWVYKQAKAAGAYESDEEFEVELVDLAELNLPMYDESTPAQAHQYDKAHTKKWAEIVGGADGFVIVSPEYNHSVPGALKNALDYLYSEWNHKPVTFVSYGSRAIEHLRAIAGELRMYDLRDQLLISNYWERLDEEGVYQFSEQEKDTLNTQLKDLLFWAKHMKQARAGSLVSA